MASTPSVAAAERAAVIAQRRERLRRDFAGRFYLRLHASVIVAGTFAAGFLANLALLGLGLDGVIGRWLIAIAVGYAMFFVLVRLWLAYVGVRAIVALDAPDASGVDVVTPRAGFDVPFRGGGGQFGGGGASGDFGAARIVDGESVLPRLASSGSKSSGGGFDLDVGDGFLVIVIGLLVLALVAALAGSALHFIWIAPELLADAAFGALLASGALPGLRRIDESDWDGHVLRATWKPLVAVVVVAVGVALALGHWFPGARTLGEAWRMIG